jgi:hypothetical protein
MTATSLLPSRFATESKLSQTVVKKSTKANSLCELLDTVVEDGGFCGAGVPPACAAGNAAQ